MASMLLRQKATPFSKSLGSTFSRFLHPSSPPLDPSPAAASNGLRSLHSLASPGDGSVCQPSDSRSVAPRSALRPDFAGSFSSLANGTRVVPSSAARSLGLIKLWNHGVSNASHSYKPSYPSMQISPRWFSMKASSVPDQSIEKNTSGTMPRQQTSEVVSFSPLEASVSIKKRPSALRSESLKIKRLELSQKITYALIPALLLVSKTKLTTSLIILSVFWQIHGFFKEIFLDYVHQEVTRMWVLIYFKLLLLIVAKDLFLAF